LIEARERLVAAEGRLETFLTANRQLASPQLVVERDRVQRDVVMQQQVVTTLMQSREEARLREVRDTPVILVLESPRVPIERDPRHTVVRAALGAIGALLLFASYLLLPHAIDADLIQQVRSAVKVTSFRQ
jgi:uncharacterized protein involved in exopolysaccharide biosynthesis